MKDLGKKIWRCFGPCVTSFDIKEGRHYFTVQIIASDGEEYLMVPIQQWQGSQYDTGEACSGGIDCSMKHALSRDTFAQTACAVLDQGTFSRDLLS